ncbi:glutamate--tRNA ligase [Desulfovibrio sp. OttesenSCG-928-M14]|nr:glutamate--tRNA ligase [Desulfovibrio sp. OttesenSCG-928-M14]
MSDPNTSPVVTRFAPSPTGHLHIGGARTAIFCWLLARHYKGRFVLRIEDTDLERSRQEYTDSILASMRWLGLDWDGEPVYQRQRFDLYNQYIDRLLEGGHAYWCDCTPEEVEAMREKARAEGKKPRYDGRCRERGLGPGPGRVARLKAPLGGRVIFQDMVKGHIAVDAAELDDMVLRKADGSPTYNLAVVVDDLTMGISHVLRGDDHVNNTPRQILIYQALGAPLPLFGHVPMILGPDRQKLSKRHGAKAVIEYEKDGLLPESLVNYLVRLGWSHGDQEIFSREDLIRHFDGTNLNSAASAFDPEKLLWVNAQHLRAASPAALLPQLVPYLEEAALPTQDAALIAACIPLLQPRSDSLKQMAALMRPLLLQAPNLDYDPAAVAKALTPEGRAHVAALREHLSGLIDFDKDSLHACIHGYVAERNLKFKAVGPPLRVALLGLTGGPDLADAMAVLGKKEVLARLDRALALSPPSKE